MRAYLASALTSLTESERRHTDRASDTVAQVCLSIGVSLYEPRAATDPVHHPDVPDWVVYSLDRERIASSDIVLFLSNHASTGSGQELVIAQQYLIPIFVLAETGRRVSRMVTGMPGVVEFLQYESLTSLAEILRARLRELVDSEWRTRLNVAAHYDMGLGRRIRSRRTTLGLSRAELAARLSPAVSEQDVEQWEAASDFELNPSLVMLRTLAGALEVPVDSLTL